MILVNARVIAEKYSIPRPTVYYYAHKGILPFHRIGGRLKFNPEKVEMVLKQGVCEVAGTW